MRSMIVLFNHSLDTIKQFHLIRELASHILLKTETVVNSPSKSNEQKYFLKTPVKQEFPQKENLYQLVGLKGQKQRPHHS